MEIFYCLLLGIVVGLVSSFLGIGGGILIVPLLPSIAGIHTKEAIATSMAIIVLVSAKNVISFAKQKVVPWGAGLSIGAGAGIGSFFSSLYIGDVPEIVLVGLLLAVIILIASRLLFGKTKNLADLSSVAKASVFNKGAFFAGIFCGIVVGLTGIGGGVLYGPILLAFGLVSGQQMSPGSNVAMLIASVTGVLAYLISMEHFEWLRWGPIYVDLALVTFVGAFFSSKLGMKYQALLSDSFRKRALVGILALVFIKSLHTFSSL